MRYIVETVDATPPRQVSVERDDEKRVLYGTVQFLGVTRIRNIEEEEWANIQSSLE